MRFVPLILFIALALFLAKGLFIPQEETPPSVLLNKPLPAFSLPTLDKGKPLEPATFKGKFVLLNVFASWCVSCTIEHPLLIQLSENKIFSIYGISWKDTPENTKQWLAQRGNPYTSVGMDLDGKVIIDLGVTGAPETFLISPEGTVLYRYAGPLTNDVITGIFLPLITEYREQKK